MSSAPNKRDLTKGPILGHVLRMSVPMAIGIGAIISFSIADMYFIGQLGATELAAVSFTIPITTLMFNVIFGLSIAMSAVVSRKIGGGLRDDVKVIATIGIAMSVTLSTLVATVVYNLMNPIFSGLGAGADVMPFVRDYMPIWLVGSVFLSVPIVANSAIRGTGDAFWPAFGMVMVAVINVILDPILIFGLWGAPMMGVQGAALASSISYFIAMVFSLSILIGREKLLAPLCLFKRIAWSMASKPLLKIAIPVSLANMIAPILIYGYTAILSIIGNEAVAAYGIASRFEAFALIPIMALAGGMAPLIGQNYGAGFKNRVEEALKKALKFCVFYGVACAIIFFASANLIARLFTDDTDIQELTSLYLMFVPLSFIGLNIFAVVTSAMNATEMPKQALVLNILKAFIVALPLSYILASLYGMEGFVIAIIVTNFIGMAFCLFFLQRIRCT